MYTELVNTTQLLLLGGRFKNYFVDLTYSSFNKIKKGFSKESTVLTYLVDEFNFPFHLVRMNVT